jgi:chemotaxis response regulator CheB
MIILVTASSRAEECAAAIEQKTHQHAQIATSLNRAIELLQTHDYEVVVLDESFQQVEIGAETLVTNHAGMAVPIYVNLSLHGAERVAQEVNQGLRRLLGEKLASMRAAESAVRNELRGEITAILLNSELAL